MQVNVFVSKASEGEEPALLILPYGPAAAIPPHLQGLEWRHLAITSPEDKLIGADTGEIEVSIAEHGYALVKPTG
ncbi:MULTISPECIES: hypothetical protein [Devosia]|uniref:hypothetical protein n=1 Tax=Devosia TaxID=46913 RepID=UPI000CE98F31|nr:MULTISPECIES: hypothetical protein [Devosia]AVF02923.1 hypothetical protein C4375_03680 [Devosia sp. I507]